MLEVANGLLAKDPNNVGMLLLLSDYYCDKADQLAKAETYAKKAISVLGTAPKPEGVADDQWDRQKNLQKGLALRDRKSTRLNSSHSQISYAVFCLKKKKSINLCMIWCNKL